MHTGCWKWNCRSKSVVLVFGFPGELLLHPKKSKESGVQLSGFDLEFGTVTSEIDVRKDIAKESFCKIFPFAGSQSSRTGLWSIKKLYGLLSAVCWSSLETPNSHKNSFFESRNQVTVANSGRVCSHIQCDWLIVLSRTILRLLLSPVWEMY